MTNGEKTQIEEQLGRELTYQERSLIEHFCRKTITGYANMMMHTDVQPYEVVEIRTSNKVMVRPMTSKQIKFPQEVHVGGFCAHVEDNRSGQDYEYTSTEHEPHPIRWSEARGHWFDAGGNRYSMSEKPYKFHDYNF